jgi:predicted house-cleaning NTP pyrophosphatase (Maf/HAM1 superfamily)
LLVSRIEGSYPNVVGFPIEQVLETLLKKGWISFCTSG